MSWLLYGANGYTGELIAREARARNLRPVLGGRNEPAVRALAQELGFEARCFSLTDVPAVARGLEGITLVLHCAGPFSVTARPMMQAALAGHVHYLDITGEIDVFELAHSLDAEARAAGVLLCPGVGFDVVPTDSLAARLKQELPDATHLALGFDSRSTPSRGTARTMVEGLRTGSRVRVAGHIESLPFAGRVREIDYGEGPKTSVAIPWGDVSTAFHTTGIPNIEVYIPSSPRAVHRLQQLNRWRFLLGTTPVQWLLKRGAGRAPPGPDAEQRAKTPVLLWGEVRNATGRVVVGRLRTANGYTVTVQAALGIVDHLLRNRVSGGHLTPSRVVGPEFITRLPGSTAIQIGAR